MHRSVIIGLVLGSGLIWAAPAWAQLTAADIDALQAQGEREGWTFTVGESDATRRPLSELCGFVAPDNWWVGARFDPCVATRALPAAYDWRNVNGQNFCPPVRNQASCGSCWAFGTIGPLECNIMIHDGDTPDLSEQWLVSCNSDGWDCGGGFWAHDYLEWKTDPCGGTGAVAEASFPYVALDVPCNCPYEHVYLINNWAYIGTSSNIPPVSSIKQAILDHGPVSVACYVNSAFHAYSGGIFNGCASGACNHAVVLVGWNDADGGYWIMRNSWGPDWGEDGYMRIPYNCSSIGYAACYVEYLGAKGLEVTPAGGLTATGEPGGPFTPNTITYVVKNQSGLAVNYEVTHTAPWLTVTNASGYLAGLATANVTVTVNATANALDVGRYTDTLEFINTTNHRGDTIRLVKLEVGSPVRVYSFPMDTNPGWSLQGQWEYGTPAGQGGSHGYPDPTAGATGSNVFGVNLQGDYTPTYGGPYYLTLGPLDFSGGAGGTLKFQRWLNSDYFPYVRNTIDASADGSNWVNVWTAGTTVMRENAWTLRSYDLPAVIDEQPTVYIRWGYQIGVGAWAYSGWNIDDVEVWAFAPPTTDCNGNGVADWIDIAGGTCADDNTNAVPDVCEKLAGDLNCDGVVGFGDINPFVLLMGNPDEYRAVHPDCIRINGDINNDGVVGFGDINAFVALLSGG